MINNKEDFKEGLLKAFPGAPNVTKLKNECVTKTHKTLGSKALEVQLQNEAATNYHKRRQRILDFLTDSFINVTKSLAIIAPIVIVVAVWGWLKHHEMSDIANMVLKLSGKGFDMIIGFLVGNMLTSVFKKTEE